MSKHQWMDDMREISGFGGGYETTCRAMVVAGLEWSRQQTREKMRRYAAARRLARADSR